MQTIVQRDMQFYIQKLVDHQNLTRDEAKDAMRWIMSGRASQSQIGGFLTAMRMKGVSVQEITAFALVMREFAVNIRPQMNKRLVDMCGTGGDTIKTFNISTAASFVVAAAGVPVAKHGNRSVTSKSGSADVLEALGAKIDLQPVEVERMIEDMGFGFMFAPVFHSSMKYALGPRKEIGIRTIFNLLGPLTNPASARAQVMGVYDESLVEPIGRVLVNLGIERALVVHGVGGLDEVSNFGPTRICEIDHGRTIDYSIDPEEVGLPLASVSDLAGGDSQSSAAMVRGILNGTEQGPRRDIVLLNAACGIYIGGAAGSVREAIEVAKDSIDSGRAFDKLNEYVRRSLNGVVP